MFPEDYDNSYIPLEKCYCVRIQHGRLTRYDQIQHKKQKDDHGQPNINHNVDHGVQNGSYEGIKIRYIILSFENENHIYEQCYHT